MNSWMRAKRLSGIGLSCVGARGTLMVVGDCGPASGGSTRVRATALRACPPRWQRDTLGTNPKCGGPVEHRRLGRTGRDVSVIGFGAWAIGGSWGSVDDAESLAALHAAADAGVTLIDTADVYGDGRSERVIGRFLRERPGETFFVPTKMG